jgi:putative ABC transport system permease protein
MLQFRAEPIGFAANEFLTGGLSMERATDIVPSSEAERQFRSTYGQRLAELERRLEAETAISDVTFSLTPPGEELAAIVEVDGATVPSSDINYNIVEGGRQGHLIRFNRVGLDFFEAFEVPLLMGRALQPDDLGAAGGGVLIDRTFMDRLFSGQNPLGRRIRYVGRSREAGEGNVVLGPWYEIVGVVSDFSSQAGVGELPDPRVYHAAAAGDVYPVMIGARVRGSAPGGQAARVREITTRLDPSLQIEGLSTAEEVLQRDQRFSRLIGVTIAAAIGSVVALSAAGIYALMSFTVSRRRKEIGIRTALGANYSRILVGIFSRAIWQLGAGGLAGIAMTLAAEALVGGEMMQGNVGVVVTIVAVFMIAVGLLASLGPARRALRMQPTEALRED